MKNNGHNDHFLIVMPIKSEKLNYHQRLIYASGQTTQTNHTISQAA